MSKTFVVTGASGYIGSHMCYELRKAYPDSTIVGVDKVRKFKLDHLYDEFLCYDLAKTNFCIFDRYKADCVFHFAAYTIVPESETDPYTYYRNNLMSSIRLLDESKRKKIVSLIKESIEEIKLESQKSIEEAMNSLDKVVKEYSKDYCIQPSKRGGYEICGCLPHHFHIRPNYMDSYDVIYIKDGADRTRHMNSSLEELKKFVKQKLNDKGNYVQKAYNKSAEQSKDQVKKEELPSTKQNPIKSLDDKKNEQKDYKENQVKEEKDLPDKPMREMDKIKKQSEHPIEGEKVKYTYPKQDKKEKKHVVKGGKGKELNLPAHKIKSK